MFRPLKYYELALISALVVVASAATDSGQSALTTWTGALIWLVPAALISALIDTINQYRKETAAMPGYANRVITLQFPELTDDDDLPDRPVQVVLRNPRLMPPGELTPEHVETDENGVPKDVEAAKYANNKIIAKLIIGWRAFDASDIRVDDDGNELPQEPLPLPATPELVAKLPLAIFKRLSQEVTNAFDPQ